MAVPVGVQGDAAGNDTAAAGPAGLTHQARHNGSLYPSGSLADVAQALPNVGSLRSYDR
jgi:hypothetical protein